MAPHDFLSIYPAKLMEYSLAIGYLLLFIPFWRYVQGGRRAEKAVARAPEVAKPARGLPGWFALPDDVMLHPGHIWARVEKDGRVTVGLDDFAHKLVGPVKGIELPALGESVAPGEPAIRLRDDGSAVSLLAPVDGKVVAVNRAATEEPTRLDDPYGQGWLFQVQSSRLDSNLRQLLRGAAARRLMDHAAEELAARVSPGVGEVLQDGGTPVHGIAREIEPADWAAPARQFFLT